LAKAFSGRGFDSRRLHQKFPLGSAADGARRVDAAAVPWTFRYCYV